MKKVLEEQLIKKYPSIFGTLLNKPKVVKFILPIYFGVDTGDGWYDLLYELCGRLVQIEKNFGIITIADQIKEKFGGLRFYHHCDLNREKMKSYKRNGTWHYTWVMNGDVKLSKPEKEFKIEKIWGEIDGLVSMAEAMSYRICEQCGLPGKPNDAGWITTLCDNCRNAKEQERAEGLKQIRKAKRAFKKRDLGTQVESVLFGEEQGERSRKQKLLDAATKPWPRGKMIRETIIARSKACMKALHSGVSGNELIEGKLDT